MKKLIAVMAFTAVLSVPSVVFAEASWYGSLRAGVDSSDGNVSVKDSGSRWGIQGSSEVSEGLTAVYQFEQEISTPDAGQPSGRLSYVGLSGGFGSVTVGKIWSASYNSVGVITDNSYHSGDSQTSLRHGNAISYAFSHDLMALQVDAVYRGVDDNADGNNDDLEKVEFGLSVNLGEIGKVAISSVDNKDTLDPGIFSQPHQTIDDTKEGVKTTTVAAEVYVANLTAYVGYQETITAVSLAGTNTNTDKIREDKLKTTFIGIRGGIGDTGIDYVFQWRKLEDSEAPLDLSYPKPWSLGLGKSLGGGASIYIEHADNDGLVYRPYLMDIYGDPDRTTRVTLQVDF